MVFFRYDKIVFHRAEFPLNGAEKSREATGRRKEELERGTTNVVWNEVVSEGGKGNVQLLTGGRRVSHPPPTLFLAILESSSSVNPSGKRTFNTF